VSAVVARDLVRRYGDRAALGGVSLEIGRAELFVLLGPSGSGKTTLLRLLAGLDRPDAGSIELFDHAVDGPDVPFVPPEKRGVGFVFQDLALWPHMTALEHVLFALGARSPRRAPADAVARGHEALSLLRLDDKWDARPGELSGGEAQRLALARAIAPRPRLLVLDEPLASLDPPLRESLAAEVLRVRGETGVTIVHVTHDRDEALALADRIAVLDRGRLLQVGTPDELYRHPASAEVASFLGEVSWVPGQVCRAGAAAKTILGEVALAPPMPELPEGAWVRVAARPENLVVGEGGASASVLRRTFDGGGWRLRLSWGGTGGAEDGTGTLLRARADRAHAAGSDVTVSITGRAAAFPIREGEGVASPRASRGD